MQTNEILGVGSYELDKNGLKMSEVYYNKQQNRENNTSVWKRKDDGTILEKKTISPNKKIIQHMDQWVYDTEGKKHKVHRTIAGGKEADFYGATHTYEYDERGNWITRTTIYPDSGNLFNNGNIRVTERKFVFY
jgi:hypothetical protein